MSLHALRTASLAAALLAALASTGLVQPPSAWDGPEIEALADRIAKEHLLERPQPVHWSTMGRDKLRDRLQELVSHEYTPEQIVDEGRLLVRLGLIAPSTSYDEIVYGLLQEQIMGLYDPGSKELLLLEDSPPPAMQGVLVHELTHAVQDMNFDLSALSERTPGRGDSNAALEAVAEGDALLMEQVLTGFVLPAGITAKQMKLLMQLMPLEGPAMTKAPEFLREVLLFPYLHGFVLVRNAYASGGYDAVNALFEHPPASTEQVLHPERLGLDPPVDVEMQLPADLDDLYRIAGDDVMGEFAIRTWLDQWILPPEAENAAAGWGGDRYLFLWPSTTQVGEEHLDHGVLVLVSTWDPGPADDPHREAEEFARALGRYLEERYPGAQRVAGPTRTFFLIPGRQVAVVERRGKSILFVEGLAHAKDQALHAAVDSLWPAGLPK